MIEVPILLAGYGPVGREYAELVRQYRAQWCDQYGADLRVVAVRGRSSQAEIADAVPPREQWAPAEEVAELLARTGARVLAQACLPTAVSSPRWTRCRRCGKARTS